MSLSYQQIEANRANAQHSTGPRTAEGKARSSRNAYKYGLRECELFPDEDAEEYAALAESLYEEYDPQTAMEEIVLANLISYAWRMQRVRRIEALRYQENLARVEEGFRGEEHAASRAFFWQEGKDFAMLQRYEAAMQRGFKNALAQLEALQKARTKPKATTTYLPATHSRSEAAFTPHPEQVPAPQTAHTEHITHSVPPGPNTFIEYEAINDEVNVAESPIPQNGLFLREGVGGGRYLWKLEK